MCLTLDSYPVACQECNYEKMCRKPSQAKLTKKMHKKVCPGTGRTERSATWEQAKREREAFTSIKSNQRGKEMEISHKGTEYLKQPPKEPTISVKIEPVISIEELTEKILLSKPSKEEQVRGRLNDGKFNFKSRVGNGGKRTRVRGNVIGEPCPVGFN